MWWSRCSFHSSRGISMRSRSRKLALWSSQTLPPRSALRIAIMAPASTALKARRRSGSSTRSLQALLTGGCWSPTGKLVALRVRRARQACHCLNARSFGSPSKSSSRRPSSRARTPVCSSVSMRRVSAAALRGVGSASSGRNCSIAASRCSGVRATSLRASLMATSRAR